MEHIVSKRITNVKKLTRWQEFQLKQNEDLEFLRVWNERLRVVLIGVGVLTLIHMIYRINELFS